MPPKKGACKRSAITPGLRMLTSCVAAHKKTRAAARAANRTR
jgi:hypothetical protein